MAAQKFVLQRVLFMYVALDKAECTEMVDIYTLTVSIFNNEKFSLFAPEELPFEISIVIPNIHLANYSIQVHFLMKNKFVLIKS